MEQELADLRKAGAFYKEALEKFNDDGFNDIADVFPAIELVDELLEEIETELDYREEAGL